MKKVSEYYQHADECRAMARTATTPEQKAMLENMAQTWEQLARNREATIRRRQRIAHLEKATLADSN